MSWRWLNLDRILSTLQNEIDVLPSRVMNGCVNLVVPTAKRRPKNPSGRSFLSRSRLRRGCSTGRTRLRFLGNFDRACCSNMSNSVATYYALLLIGTAKLAWFNAQCVSIQLQRCYWMTGYKKKERTFLLRGNFVIDVFFTLSLPLSYKWIWKTIFLVIIARR